MIAQKETALGRQPESGEIDSKTAQTLRKVTKKVSRASLRKNASLVMAEGLRKIKPEVVGATGLPSHYCERLADKISECSSWLLIRGNSSRVRIAASIIAGNLIFAAPALRHDLGAWSAPISKK